MRCHFLLIGDEHVLSTLSEYICTALAQLTYTLGPVLLTVNPRVYHLSSLFEFQTQFEILAIVAFAIKHLFLGKYFKESVAVVRKSNASFSFVLPAVFLKRVFIVK